LRAIGDLIDQVGGLDEVRDPAGFVQLRDAVRGEVAATMALLVDGAATVATLAGQVRAQLGRASQATASDVTEQLDGLVFAGFIAATSAKAWPHLPRYLRGALRRLETDGSNPKREMEAAAAIAELEDEYARLCARISGALPVEVVDVGWLLEELRVSLFAQSLGTSVPVSPKRVRAAVAAAARSLGVQD